MRNVLLTVLKLPLVLVLMSSSVAAVAEVQTQTVAPVADTSIEEEPPLEDPVSDVTLAVTTPDVTPPTLAITAPVGTVYNDTTPAATVTFSDDIAGVDVTSLDVQVDGVSIAGWCVVDEVAGTAVCESIVLTAGAHVITASIADLAGHVANATGSFDLVFDPGAPTLDITAPVGTVVGDSTPAVTVTFSDGETAVNRPTLKVRVDGFDITASCVIGGTSATCEPPALGEGVHTTTAEITDLAGNLATASQSFTLDLGLTDAVVPSLAITSPSQAVLNDPNPAITVTYSDAESGVDLTTLRIAVDGFELVTDGRCVVGVGSATCTPPILGAGTHAVTANVEDLANIPAAATASFNLSFSGGDTVAPVVTISEPAEPVVFEDFTPQITVTYSDADSGVAILTLAVDVDGTDITAGCLVGDSLAVCEPPPLIVGTHVVTATVEDLHGRVGTGSFGFDIAPDVTPPVIAIAQPSTTPLDVDVTPIRVTYTDDETGVDLSSLVITLDATDLTATCSIGPTEASCTSPVLADGSHSVAASIQDLAVNPTSASFALVIDTTAPTLAITTPIGAVLGDSTPAVTVTFSDGETAVNRGTLKVRVDGFDITPSCVIGTASAICEPPALGQGVHTTTAVAADVVGNLATASQSFTLDLGLSELRGPSLAITSPPPLVSDDPDPAITVTYSDVDSGVDLTTLRIAVDGFELITDGRCVVGVGSATCTPPLLGAGTHVVTANVEDLANNLGTASASFDLTFTIGDTVAPVVTIIEPAATVVFDDFTPQITVSYSDADSGVAILTLAVDVDGTDLTAGCVVGDLSAVCEAPSLTVGTHVVTATVADLLGNVGTGSFSFQIALTTPDTTAPTLAITAPVGTVYNDTTPAVTVSFSDDNAGVHVTSLDVRVDGVSIAGSCVVDEVAGTATCEAGELTAGFHTVSASVADRAGNVASASASFELVIDTGAPKLGITTPVGAVVGDSTPAVTVTFSDGETAVSRGTLKVRVDGYDITASCVIGGTSATCEPPALGEGLHTTTAEITDLAGNVTIASQTFALDLGLSDTVAPSLAITSPPPLVSDDPDPAITVTYSDVDSGVDLTTLRIAVDGFELITDGRCVVGVGSATCSPPLLGAGTHAVTANVEDLANNPGAASASFDLTFTIGDTVAPVVTIIEPAATVVFDDFTPQITVTYSDADSWVAILTLAVGVDGTDLTAGCVVGDLSAVCEAPSLTVGTHVVTATVADLLGNVGTRSIGFEIALTTPDTTAPTLAITAPVGTVYNDTTPAVTVSFSDDNAGVHVTSMHVLVDGVSIAGSCVVDEVAGTATCEAGELTAGFHTVLVSVVDRAGNVASASASFELVIDTGAPTLGITTPVGAVVGDSTPAVTVTFSDGETAVNRGTLKVRVDGFDITASCVIGGTSATCEPPALGEGVHTTTAEAADLAGNVTIASQTFALDLGLSDTVAPSLAITSPPPLVSDDPDPAITVTYSDVDSGVDLTTLRIAVDGFELITDGRCVVGVSSATCTPPLLRAGTHVVTANVEDLANNPGAASASFSLSLTIVDRVAPVVTITEPAEPVVFDDFTPQITVSYSDADSGVAILTLAVDVDGTDITAGCVLGDLSTACEAPSLTVGTHVVTATMADLLGNVGTDSFSFQIALSTPDTTPPTLAITAPVGTVYNDTTPAVTVSFSDDNAGVYVTSLDVQVDFVSIAGSCVVDEVAGTATCEAGELTAGFHRVSASVADRVGNVAFASDSFFDLVIDTGVPTLGITNPVGAVVGDSTPAVTVTFSDGETAVNRGTLKVRVDGYDITASCVIGGTSATCEPPALGEGVHTTTVEAADVAGNLATASQSFTLDLGLSDTVAPSLAIISPPPLVSDDPDPAITVTYSDVDSGVDLTTLRIAVDGFDLVTDGRCVVGVGSATCTPPLLRAGTHVVTANVEDLANNPGAASASFSLSLTIVDRVAPVVTITEPAEPVVFDDFTPQITVSYSDADSGVAILTLAVDVDGTDITAGCVLGDVSTACEAPSLTVGTHVVTATVADLLGNVGTDSFSFQIALSTPDTTPPTLAITAPVGTVYNDTTPAVTVSFSDDNAGVYVTSLDVQVDFVSIAGSCVVDEVAGTATCEAGELTAGFHRVSASVADRAGNFAFASDRFFELVIDTGAPTLEITTPVGAVVGDSTPAVTVTFSDGETAVNRGTLKVRVDGFDITASCVIGTASATCEPPALGEGVHTTTVEAADVAGNLATASQTFTLDLGLSDTVAPSLAIISPPPLVSNDPDPAITVTYSDVDSGVDLTTLRIAVDGFDLVTDGRCVMGVGSATCTPPLLGAGTHVVTASVEDLANNPGTASASFILSLTTIRDTVAPVVTITEPAEPVVFDDFTPQITVSYSDADSGVAILTLAVDVDGTDITAGCVLGDVSTACEAPSLTVGTHVVTATVEDLLGNVGTGSFSFQIALSTPDTTPPTLAITAPVGTVYNDTTPAVTVSFSDDNAGVYVTSLDVRVDGVSIAGSCVVDEVAGTATCEAGELTAGFHTVSASVADRAGNVASASASFELVIDTGAPTLDITAPVGAVVGDSTPAVTVTFSDGETAVNRGTLKVRVDGFDITASCVIGGTLATCEPPALGEGVHTTTAEAADVAGNLATTSQTFTLDLGLSDTVAPSLAITSPPPLVSDDPAPAITVTYSDVDSGVDLTTLRIAVDGFELVTDGRCVMGVGSATCTPPLLGRGTHAVTANVEDLANNPGTASASFDLTFTIGDTVAPVVTIIEPAETVVFDDLTPQITVSYSDADSGVAILTLAVDVDGTDIMAGCVVGDVSTVCEPPPLTVGTHVVTVTVADLHGNVGIGSIGFEIALTTPDTTPPAIAIAEPAMTPLNVDVTPIRVTYADGETGVDLSSLVIALDLTDLTATCDVGLTEATCTSPVLAEGPHTVSASIQDLAGNSASASFPFDVVPADVDPPELTVATPPAVVLDDPTPAVTVEYSDLGSGVNTLTLRVFVDVVELAGCVVQPTVATCEPPPLGTGEHRVRAEMEDFEGNLGSVERLFFVQLDLVDETPPTVVLTSPVNPIIVDDSSPEVRVEYSDADSGVDVSSFRVLMDGVSFSATCVLDALGAVCEPPDLAQGSHQVVARVRDLIGNLGEASFNFEIQLSAPEVDPPTLVILGPTGTVQDDPNPEILLQYSDAGSGVALVSLVVQVDGIPVTSGCLVEASSATCQSPTLGAGLHTVTASLSDLAGNQTMAQAVFTLEFTSADTLPPTLVIESPADVVTQDSTLASMAYSDAESGVDLASVTITLDGTSLTDSCQVGLERTFCNLVALTDGSHTLSVSVADLQGNLASASHSFLVDLVPPDLVAPNIAVLHPETVVLDDPQPEVRIEYSDTGSGVDSTTLQVTLDGLDILAGCLVGADAATCTPSALGAGSHTVLASVEDLEGNTGNASLTFELVLTPPDVTPPGITIDEPSAVTLSEENPLRVLLSYSDVGSGIDIASLQLALDGLDVTSFCLSGATGATCSLGIPDLGSHSLTATIADVSGNPGTASHLFEVVAETQPPTLRFATPAVDPVRGDSTPEIRIEYSDSASGVDTASLQVLLDGVDLLASCVVEAAFATCEPPPLSPESHRVVAQIADLRSNASTASLTFQVSLDLEIAILVPASGFLTQDAAIDVSGTVSPEAETVTVHGVSAVVSSGTFLASGVELDEGTNTLTAVARTANGGVGSTTVAVVRDTTAPLVVIQSPPDGFVTTASQVLVTGEYNDPSSSGTDFTEAAVTVNGVPAGVEQRTFVLEDHLLQPGENTIRVEATDAAGNLGSAEVAVTLLTNPVQKIEELLGNGQSGTVGLALSKPLVVRVTDGIGNPLEERLVTFEVTRGDGRVRSAGDEERSLTVRTDSLGRAQVDFILGERSGMGNHEVTVTSVGFPGSLVFCASAEPLPAHRIVRVQGNVQTGTLVAAVGEELPKPLYTQVFDAMKNPVAGAQVTYEVVTGGGSFGGEPTLTTGTDANGIASAVFTLGPIPGVNVHVVKASIPNGAGSPAVFNISGLEPGPEELTSLSGLVLDNQDLPVPGVTVSVRDTSLAAITDAEGRFQISGAPVGTVHLVADGTTTTLAGAWPVLEFEMVTVSGQINELGMPIRLLPIDPGVLVGGDVDVEIPLEGVPGASLTVFANSATFAGGSTEGLVSFTQVHNDKVPMVTPLGSMFAIALTIQPPSVRFDPPAQIQIPNPGHKPGEEVDIFSFDHDLGEFVSAGTGSVTPDGLFLRSNPGFGARKGGWHGAAQPVPDTDACNEGTCTVCTPDGPQPNCAACEECTGNGCVTPILEEVTAVAQTGGGSSSNLVAASRVGQVVAPATAEEDELIIGVGQEVLLEARNLVGRCAGTLAFTWSFGDASAAAMGQAVSHVYESIGVFVAGVIADCEGCLGSGSASDSVAIKVIDIDLRLQNLPEESDPLPNEIDPGGIVALNNDDDDQDGTIDRVDNTTFGEDDMELLRLDVDPLLNEGRVTLDLTAGVGKIKVWDDRGKTTAFELPKTWNLENEEVPGIVWIEGVERSIAMADVMLVLRYENDAGGMVEDEVNVTVMEVDVDVDSDNSGQFDLPARNTFEDENEDVEMDPFDPGKYVVVNHDDDDQDEVTDFADGFNHDAADADDDANPQEMFVPLVLELVEPIDVAQAKIRLTYDASDPAGVNVVQVAQIPPVITIPDYQKPAAGHLRIWTVQATGRTGSANVKAGGEFVAPDTYTTAELGFGAGREVTLYVEAVTESANVGDQRLLVEVDPDGDAGPRDFMLEDAVRFTAVMLEVQDTAAVAPARPLIEGGDMAFVSGDAPQMPQLTARLRPNDLRSDVIIDCKLAFEYDRSARGRRNHNCGGIPDKVELPVGALAFFMFPGDTWNIATAYPLLPAGSQFFGGDGFVQCRYSGLDIKHEFLIRGRNPEDPVARDFIDATVPYWFAYAIVKHETEIPDVRFLAERYHQFDLRDSILYQPVTGAPDGWGMFQIDFDADRRAGIPNCLTSTQIWNWQENVRRVVPILNAKETDATNWLNSENPRIITVAGRPVCDGPPPFPHGQRPQSRGLNGAVYGTNPDPCVVGSVGVWIQAAQAVAIMDHVVGNCTFSEMGRGDGTFEDAGTIQCNNGCTPHYVVWDGMMWTFRPNRNNYVDEICHEVDP